MDRITRSARNGVARRDRKIRIFLSHKLEDEERANSLEMALRSAAEGGIDVFRAPKIEPGAPWLKSICENINKSDILLLLYTDDSRSWVWCLFECGMFLQSGRKVENPLICLHHPEAELPDPIKHLKSFPGIKDNAYKLLKYILHDYPIKRGFPLINPDLFEQDEAHRDLLDRCCSQIVKAIGEKAERHYVHEAWMRTTVCSSDVIENKDSRGADTYDLRPGVHVELSRQLSAILSIHQEKINWGRLSRSAVSDKRWLPALSRIIFYIMKGNATSENWRSILQMFRSHANSRLYRPYVHQVDRGADGRCCFYVHFMEESSLDYNSLSRPLGSLFTGMTLGVRFRHELLKQYRRQLDNHLLEQKCRDVMKDIWHTIEQIEQESNARGINDPDSFPIAFGQYGEEISRMFEGWDGIRKRLVEICLTCELCERDKKGKQLRCDQINTMDKLLDTLWDMNGRFLFLTSARIHEVIAGEV